MTITTDDVYAILRALGVKDKPGHMLYAAPECRCKQCYTIRVINVTATRLALQAQGLDPDKPNKGRMMI